MLPRLLAYVSSASPPDQPLEVHIRATLTTSSQDSETQLLRASRQHHGAFVQFTQIESNEGRGAAFSYVVAVQLADAARAIEALNFRAESTPQKKKRRREAAAAAVL